MNWMRLIAIILGAGVVSSFTDWFFAGDWRLATAIRVREA
jgi:hypothetical protein